ncbi:MerR HTH family regulatory protein [Bryocella elongata]|uniref:MerR HTH family regulatory protein n=1 Tax=Bryocella elongata TaxID=863522 RepID=A0A1H6AHK7_9BACT|nr:MerR family transcriptional regulator [Bryocella elongata]SEG47740.1 MerR HTH family regulatory protein [Bryocella elongata]
MAVQNPIRKNTAKTPEIPDKLYFRIGDVARICEVPAYVLRFWESEFPHLKPNKGGTGQRLYRRKDVEVALRIKTLLYDQGYTIPGARQVFKGEAKPKEAASFAAEPVMAPAAPAISMAAPAPTQMPVREPLQGAQVASITTLRREAAIQLLRDDLRALAAILARPVNMDGETATPGPTKVRTMRPRLVERNTEKPADRGERFQGDLFTTE